MLATCPFASYAPIFDAETSKKVEAYLRKIYDNFAKEERFFRFSDFAQMLMEKNLLTNKFGIFEAHHMYFSVEKAEMKMQVDNFLKLMQRLSRKLYAEAENPLEKLAKFLRNEKLNFKDWKSDLTRGVLDVHV